MYTTKQFNFDKHRNTLTAEYSELAAGQRVADVFERSGDDVFVRVRSNHTGTIRKFLLTECHYDADWDITHWSLQHEDSEMKMIIFND